MTFSPKKLSLRSRPVIKFAAWAELKRKNDSYASAHAFAFFFPHYNIPYVARGGVRQDRLFHFSGVYAPLFVLVGSGHTKPYGVRKLPKVRLIRGRLNRVHTRSDISLSLDSVQDVFFVL